MQPGEFAPVVDHVMRMPSGELVTHKPAGSVEATAAKQLKAASHAVTCKTTVPVDSETAARRRIDGHPTPHIKGVSHFNQAAFAVRVVHAVGGQDPSTVQVLDLQGNEVCIDFRSARGPSLPL